MGLIKRLSSENLSSRFLQGSFWLGVFELVRHGSQLALTVILARLLEPRDFGLLAMAMILIGLLDSFSELGIRASLVQKKGNIDHYLDTAWTVQLFRGILLFGIIVVTAPLVAAFFDEPMLRVIVPVLALKPVCVGLTNPAVAYFLKDLDFKRQFILQSSGVIIRLVVVVPLAFALRNVWVLVIGNISVSASRMVISYVLYPYRPKCRLEIDKALELFHFGKWLLGSQVLHVVFRTVPSTVVGRLLNASSLGVFRVADQFGFQPAFIVRQIANKVLFPIYAKLQEDRVRVAQAYQKVFGLVSAIIIPVSIGGFVLRETLVQTVLGAKWHSVADPLGIFFLSGAVQISVQTSFPLFMGIGIPRVNFWVRVISMSAMLMLIYPLFLLWGVEGVALTILLSQGVTVPYWLYTVRRFIDIRIMDMARTVGPTFIGVALMTFIVDRCNHPAQETVLGLIMIIFTGAAVFLIVIVSFWRLFKMGPVKEIAPYL